MQTETELMRCDHGAFANCGPCASLKKHPRRAATYAEYADRKRRRESVISTNRSRRMRRVVMPPLPVPEKLDPPFVRVAYEKDGTYIGVVECAEDAPAGSRIAFEPALRDFPLAYYVTEGGSI